MNFLTILLIIAILLFLIAVFVCFCYYQNNKLDITTHTVVNENCKKNFRIIQLSDFHSKPFKAVLQKVSELQPDIICITGDYINDYGKNKDKMLEYGKELLKLAPVYYITGNHERRLDSFDTLMKEFADIGFIVLLNDISDCQYCRILGLDENQADFKDYKARKNGTFVYKDMSRYFELLNNYDGFKLVLSHFPENFEGIPELNYKQYDFDLQLSGHAHGGQWIIFKPLFSPGQGVLPKYARGTFGNRPRLIISRGLGNSEFPLRLFNHPEIIVVDVKKA